MPRAPKPSPARLLCCAGKGFTSQLRGRALHRRHPLKLFGQIKSHKQGSWPKDLSLRDQHGAIWPVDLEWLCAGPGASGRALKSVQKFSFSHEAVPFSNEPKASPFFVHC